MGKQGKLLLVDGAKNTVLDTVEIGRFLGSIAIDSNTEQIYVFDDEDIESGSDKILIFKYSNDKNKLTQVSSIPVDFGSVSFVKLAYNPNTKRLYVADAGNGDPIYVVNTENNTIITTLQPDILAGTTNANGSVRAIAINPNTNKLYIAYEDNNTDIESIVVVDGVENTLDTEIDLPQGTDVFSNAIAISSATNKLYVVENKNVIVIEGVGGITTSSSSSGGATTGGGDIGSGIADAIIGKIEDELALEAFSELANAFKELAKSTKSLKGTLKKFLSLKKAIERAIRNLPPGKCKAGFEKSLPKLEFVLSEAVEKVCDDVDVVVDRKDCVPKDVADKFLLVKEENFTQLSEALETDNNGNGIPDSCDNNTLFRSSRVNPITR